MADSYEKAKTANPEKADRIRKSCANSRDFSTMRSRLTVCSKSTALRRTKGFELLPKGAYIVRCMAEQACKRKVAKKRFIKGLAFDGKEKLKHVKDGKRLCIKYPLNTRFEEVEEQKKEVRSEGKADNDGKPAKFSRREKASFEKPGDGTSSEGSSSGDSGSGSDEESEESDGGSFETDKPESSSQSEPESAAESESSKAPSSPPPKRARHGSHREQNSRKHSPTPAKKTTFAWRWCPVLNRQYI